MKRPCLLTLYFPILLLAPLSVPLSASPVPPSSLPLLSAPLPQLLAWPPEHGGRVHSISSRSLALGQVGCLAHPRDTCPAFCVLIIERPTISPTHPAAPGLPGFIFPLKGGWPSTICQESWKWAKPGDRVSVFLYRQGDPWAVVKGYKVKG